MACLFDLWRVIAYLCGANGVDLQAQEFLSLYAQDHRVGTLTAWGREGRAGALHIEGLHGSLDAVFLAAAFRANPLPMLAILDDREEAVYFLNDLQSLLGSEEEVLFFPRSHKKAYLHEEVQNANVRMRVETLTSLTKSTAPRIVITHPEALGEKVVQRRSLTAHTLTLKKGERLESGTIEDFVQRRDFERVDFVQQAGQYALRGGIIDVFEFAGSHPYRIERLGNEIRSLRTFDPNTQLSLEELAEANLAPDVQARLIHEARQSFLDFIAPTTQVWLKDGALLRETLAENMRRASARFAELSKTAGETRVVLEPAQLFVGAEAFMQRLEDFSKVEFGRQARFAPAQTLHVDAAAQMSFNKKFDLLAEALAAAALQGQTSYIASETPKQLDRLHNALEQMSPEAVFVPLMFSLRAGFIDRDARINCYTDHQLFDRFHRGREKTATSKAITLQALQSLQPGDFVTHIDHGIGKFAGMEKRTVEGREQEAMRIVFRNNDVLYVSVHALQKISKYSGKEGAPPVINALGGKEWESKKAKVKKRVKDIAKELIALYARRKQAPGYAFSPDSVGQAELESSFIYVDTPDQAAASESVKRDMETPHPMDRLVCGDVGFGKTEVAIRAAFKAVNDGKQVAVLAPTTILALQHYRTFGARLANLPVCVEYISRFRSAKESDNIVKNLAKGAIDILIGTHRLVGKDLKFKDLGLLIIDEEQKFGVATKEKLKELKVNVDTLTLTATPIPRTLHFSLMGARDLSIISTPPPNRQPIATELHTYDDEIVRDAISAELKRKGQVFFVHNRVSDIEEVASRVLSLAPDAKVGVAHGQMDGERLERTMTRFIDGEYDVLVSTNIIESGLDIPNANTVIVNQAHTFGLSDLHQIRGRVGRSNRRAFCYLFIPPVTTVSSDSRKRLAALEEFSELGDGLKVAMRDLEIRGAGNILGGEQTGFINDLGFEAYHDVLDEAIQELKEGEFRELFLEELSRQEKPARRDCVFETDLEILIPETYIENASERLRLYSALSRLKRADELTDFESRLRDRFGPPPQPVLQLIHSMQIKWSGDRLGAERIALKGGKLKVCLSSSQERPIAPDTFERVVAFIQQNPAHCHLKERGERYVLEIRSVQTIDKAVAQLHALEHSNHKEDDSVKTTKIRSDTIG